MAFLKKDDDNVSVLDINTIKHPITKTLIDRYVFASNFCKEKLVLDCACGYGYGTMIIKALGAERVDGWDIDNKAISYAQEKYHSKDVKFIIQDITESLVSMQDNQYDVIVSIETFEHIKKEDAPKLLENFYRLCKPNGTIIITTPKRTTPTFEYQGGTHLYEYNINEFLNELRKYFSTIELYYALEFTISPSPELNTVFTKNHNFGNNSAVMIAVIKNIKGDTNSN